MYLRYETVDGGAMDRSDACYRAPGLGCDASSEFALAVSARDD